MEKEIIKIKPGESLELDIGGKILQIEQETEVKSLQTEHTKSALGVFLDKMEKALPELKGEPGTPWEKGDKGEKGDKWDNGDKWDPGKDGKDGIDGTNGTDGKDGKSAYDLAVEKGYTGTLDEFLASLKWQKGDKGEQGKQWDPGRPGWQGANGVSIAGPAGMSAYQIAVVNGFIGTEVEWLASLWGGGGGSSLLTEYTENPATPSDGQQWLLKGAVPTLQNWVVMPGVLGIIVHRQEAIFLKIKTSLGIKSTLLQ